MKKNKLKILIVYKCLGYPLRTTIDEHLYSFTRYLDATVFYLKLDIGKYTYMSEKRIPSYFKHIDFDLIIFHYGFISSRTAGTECYQRALNQVLCFKNSKAIKAVMPQDEYLGSESIRHFINEMHINLVFSVSPESEWDILYQGINRTKVKFHKVLTGYLDDSGIETIKGFLKNTEKDIDIGYRARNLPQWLGRHGYMKTIISDEFNKSIKNFPTLKTNISTNPKDTFLGLGWYKFMVRCKYMIGVEGGATVHDPDGSISKKSAAYLKEHPNCTFEEIEEACFPGLDGKLQLIAISPRNLESCATRTCQILIESTFNGILKPNVHYIPIKKDLSNIDEVLQIVSDDQRREEITNNAYRDIVETGLYSYRNFVHMVVEKSMADAKDPYFIRTPKNNFIAYSYNRFSDWLSWKKDFYWYKVYKPIDIGVPGKWFFLEPLIKLIKFLRIKGFAKFIYFRLTGKKSFP